MPAMECRRCGGDIEYEMERVDSGDGVWAQSGWVGIVICTDEGMSADGFVWKTGCECWWSQDAMADINDEATERAAEYPGEP